MGEKADVYQIDNFRKTHPVPSRDKIESGRATKDNPPGGGEDMEKQYATKEELKTLETKIDGQFNTLNATIKGGFDTAKAENETRFAELEAKQTKWFVGTAIAIIALVVTLVKLI